MRRSFPSSELVFSCILLRSSALDCSEGPSTSLRTHGVQRPYLLAMSFCTELIIANRDLSALPGLFQDLFLSTCLLIHRSIDLFVVPSIFRSIHVCIYIYMCVYRFMYTYPERLVGLLSQPLRGCSAGCGLGALFSSCQTKPRIATKLGKLSVGMRGSRRYKCIDKSTQMNT